MPSYLESGFNENLIRTDNVLEGSYDMANIGELLQDGSVSDQKVGTLTADKIIAGTITSKLITLAVSDGQGDVAIMAGKTAFDNTETGFILGMDDSDSNKPKFYIGSATKYLNWDGTNLTVRGTLNADDITAGTITGRDISGGTITGATLQTAASGYRVVIDTNDMKFYDGATSKGSLGYYISGVSLDGDPLFIISKETLTLEYNDGGGTGAFQVLNNGTAKFAVDDAGDGIFAADVYVGDDIYVTGSSTIGGTLGVTGKISSSGNIQCGGTFESSDGSDGGNYSSYGFVTAGRISGGSFEGKWREITVKDGLVTNISSESVWK